MKKYLGVKLIEAEPMTDHDFRRNVKVLTVPHSEENSRGYKVVYPDGYVSWSPKGVFEEAYRETEGMNFGLALEAAKKGFKIARAGWNGKGMFIVYQKGYPQGIPCNEQTAKAWGMNQGDPFRCEPYLQMRAVTGTHFMWTPNTLDMLADDWQIVE